MHSSPNATGYPANATFDFVNDSVLAQSTKDDRLSRIFRCIQENGYTLQTFLKDACYSNDEDVKGRVSYFFSLGGAINTLLLWVNRFPTLMSEPAMHELAIRVVSKVVDNELIGLSRMDEFRRPASRVTYESIRDTTLGHISRNVDAIAPKFSQLMRRFIGKEERPNSARLFPVMASMIMYNRSNRSNFLQSVIGIHLFSTRCPSSVVTLLQRMALSTSRWTVKSALRSLTRQAISKIQQVTKDEPFGFLYDNINMPGRKHDQRLNNMDTFENGATATIIPGLNLGGIESNSCTNVPLNMQDLTPSKEEIEHWHHVARYHLIGVLQRTHSSLSIDSMVFSVRKLAVTVTPTLPLPTMKIDQSTLEGNLSILNNVMQGVIGLPEEYFEKNDIPILGDQLTISRVSGLKRSLEEDLSRYKRLEWAIPVIQLFHTQMMFAQLLLRTHYGKEDVPGSLGYNKALLDRKRINIEKLNFHDVDELLRHSFDAMVLRLWEVELGSKDGSDMERMLCANDIEKRSILILSKARDLVQSYLTSEGLKRQSNTANFNSALFMRDMINYIELASAIKSGDVGRVELVLRWITITTQAGFTSNYANELLKLQFGLKNSNEERKGAILQSWLVNTKGEENGFIPSDLFQEHCNKIIKDIFASKGSNASWEMLAELISTNIKTFEMVKSELQREFDIPNYDSKHQPVSAAKDINTITGELRRHNIFSRDVILESHNGRSLSLNLLDQGMKNLVHGKLAAFNNSNK